MSDITYLTQEGLDKMKTELDHLINVRRPEISDKLQKAIAEGDLKENANYHDAKEQQGFMEGRIQELQAGLRNVKIIEPQATVSGVIRVGSTAVITEVGLDEDEEEEYRIVGAREADPANGYISNESPIGVALLGKKRGQTVKVLTPGGEVQLKILKVK